MTGLGDMEEEIGNGASLFNDHGRDDSDFQADGLDPPILYRSEWGDDPNYDIRLCGRIGLQCYNLQKGTNFKFKSWEICRDQMTSSDDSFITLEATDPATGSVLSFQTLLSDFGPRRSLGVRLLWINLASRIEPIRNERLDDNWDKNKLHDFYKGPMPKWFSDEALESNSRKYYVVIITSDHSWSFNFYIVTKKRLVSFIHTQVPESEMHDNDWLQLLMEVAFFSKTDRGFDGDLPLELNKAVVETFEDEPLDKLKADNAIFYLSYKCCADPSSTDLAGDHLGIVRKTMDGKPGHMSLEVALTKEQEKR
ncbi:UPF0725 protein At5g63820-like isoform X1 [Brassica napus]|uniref:UPF0725 protein At5g63820-like isoform X1 n=1 Tax=Brassica napus TaxID=3708 RepID=UPI0004F17BCE|nr:UPF0725 protein At5g63820-like isoform X1 [Brassica napus]